jgi:hypothetical protein
MTPAGAAASGLLSPMSGRCPKPCKGIRSKRRARGVR